MNSDGSVTGELAQRVEMLERSNRRLRRVACMALFVSAFVLLVQVLAAVRPDPRSLEARELVVRDPDGVVRARLAVREGGEPELELRDAHGRQRVHLDLAAEGSPSFVLNGTDERVRAGLAMLPDGRPQLALLGQPGLAGVQLTIAAAEEGEGGVPIGAGRLLLRDAAGALAFEAP